MQTMIEKLRLIADAIEQEKRVEWKSEGALEDVWSDELIHKSFSFVKRSQYRIAPDKPRVGIVEAPLSVHDSYDAVELTPDVREALKAAGVEI